MATWIEVRTTADQPVYDAGCGNGELLRLLSGTGRQLWGSDIEPGHVAVAIQRTGLPADRFQVGAACDVFPDGRFPIITAIGWLHNDWPSLFATGIPARPKDESYLRKTLKQFQRQLFDDGLLIIDKPDPLVSPEFWECGFVATGEIRDNSTGDRFWICRKSAQQLLSTHAH